MTYRGLRYCANPRCGDIIDRVRVVQLCSSCQYVGRLGLLIGAIVAGLLMKLFG